MTYKLTTAAAAIAAMGIAGTAMASNLIDNSAAVTIDVHVQEIAVLSVIKASGEMILDDNTDYFMSRDLDGIGPTSWAIDDTSVLAQVRMNTNFDVDAMRLNWDRNMTGVQSQADANNGIVNTTNFAFAVACPDVLDGTCDDDDALGVFPNVVALDGENGSVLQGGDRFSGFGLGTGPQLTGLNSRNRVAGPFGNGTHVFGVGVSTAWTNVTPSGTDVRFAKPDVYSIGLTVDMIPTL